MRTQTKTAVVILNWNGKKFLEQFLPFVLKHSQNSEAEIYVADNASNDDSLTFMQEYYPEIKTIIMNKNYGFAGGYNKALSQIEAEYFILLNSDVEVTENWINPIIQLMDNDKKIAAVSPKIRSYNNRDFFEYAGASGGFIDKYGYPFCRGRIISELEKDTNQYNEIIETFWATGACLFIKSEYFFKIGGFDEDFFAHMEEIDLCWRLKNQGYKIMVYPDTEVFHVGGGTLSKENPYKTFLNFRNNLLLLYKNLHTSKVFFTILARLILDGFSGIVFLFSFRLKSFYAVLKAHLAFYTLIPKFKEKRRILKPNNKRDFKQIHKKSIVIDFFIRKNRTFDNLGLNQ